MAHVPPIRRLFLEDVINSEGNIDPEKMLYSVNLFMESTYTLFDGGITLSENLASQVEEFTFTTSSSYTASNTWTDIEFQNKLRTQPMGIILLNVLQTNNESAVIKNAVSLQWGVSQNTLKITFITGLANNTKYSVRVLVV